MGFENVWNVYRLEKGQHRVVVHSSSGTEERQRTTDYQVYRVLSNKPYRSEPLDSPSAVALRIKKVPGRVGKNRTDP